MVLSLCRNMEIKTKQGSFPAWQKCTSFNIFLCYLQIPLQKLHQSKNWDWKLLIRGMQLQSYRAEFGEREQMHLTKLPISSLSYLHCTDEFQFSWIQEHHSHRYLYCLNFIVPNGNTIGVNHPRVLKGWYPFAQSTPQCGPASITVVVSPA